MQDSKDNIPPKAKRADIRTFSGRRRALVNLLIMPLYLGTVGCLGYLLWQISIKWVTASDTGTKLIWVISGLIIITLEILLVIYVKRFSKWVFSSKPSDSEGTRDEHGSDQ
jgi:hypothetical protein